MNDGSGSDGVAENVKMDKGEIEIKRIEDPDIVKSEKARRRSYRKRKGGLKRQAEELSGLCTAEVSVLIISESGEVAWLICRSIERIAAQYQQQKKGSNFGKPLMRLRKGEDLNDLNYQQLDDLEETMKESLENVPKQVVKVKSNFDILTDGIEGQGLLSTQQSLQLLHGDTSGPSGSLK